MVYGLQSSPLTPCCNALLSYWEEKSSDKVRTLRYISKLEFDKITTPQERCKIEQLGKLAESLNTDHNQTNDQLAQNLLSTIETLWYRYRKLYESDK